MQPKRYQELSVTMKILVVSLCMGLPFFFSKANGSGESSQLSRGYSSLSLTFFAKTICDVQNDMVCAMGVYQYPEKAHLVPGASLRRHFESRETAELRIAGECHFSS